MTRRTIRVTLTEAQYNAILRAICLQEAEYEGESDDTSRDAATLQRASDALVAAWNARAK